MLTRSACRSIVAAIIAIALVAALGVVIERLVVRPLWDRNATMFVIILATLAAQIVIERSTLLAVGDQPQDAAQRSPTCRRCARRHRGELAAVLDRGHVARDGGAARAVLRADATGRAMRACAINREAAALQGIPVTRMLACPSRCRPALGAVAGILITPTQYTAFNVGVPFAISGFIAAIIGGFGNAMGAFIGGIMLGVLQSGAIVMFGAGLKNVAALSVLLLFMLARPSGLLGKGK